MNPSLMNLFLTQVINWLKPLAVHGSFDLLPAISRVHTDSRTLQAGDLFVALKGVSFDANQFLSEAKAAGALAAICHEGCSIEGLVCIEVTDTQLALGNLARFWRDQFNIPIIAVTGSNGKTTTTQIIASVLEAAYPNESLATLKNFNNEIGVPLTLLRLRPHHRAAVIEIGINHPGEMAYLASLVKPTVALINNALREHLEFLHNIKTVAHENGQVLRYLTSTGTAVLPKEDIHCDGWLQLTSPRTFIRFALKDKEAEVQCTNYHAHHSFSKLNIKLPNGERLDLHLGLAGIHNIKNALAAISCAFAAGIETQALVQGIEQFSPVSGRLQFHYLTQNNSEVTIIDDTYNANPDAVQSAIEVLASQKGPRLLVLGSMAEVGNDGPLFHQQVAQAAQAAGIEFLFSFGDLGKNSSAAFKGGRHFEHIDNLTDSVKALLPQLGSALIKGSRSMRMERVVASVLGIAPSTIDMH